MTVKGTIDNVVVVGGGTAGWLAACLIAARARDVAAVPITVTLIESPDVPTIGVGEGTWPTMRGTLERIGIDEADFLIACDATFKQGSRFDGWRTGKVDSYDHPFVPPAPGHPRALVAAWQACAGERRFADVVAAQPAICAQGLAPRQRQMPGYAGALNYAYHLDAGKFAAMLATHAVERLGVRHMRDHVVHVAQTDDGDIAAVDTRANGAVPGDLFLDCTGQAALLIGQALGVGFVDRSPELPNDRALAVQLPVAPDSPIATQTIATAHSAGWLWDIGLPTRRGIGCVYASRYMDDEAALATLSGYIARIAPDAAMPPVRRLAFRSGHRERFWVGNCLAVGLSAGFLEPLEASAIVLVELSVEALLASFPATRDAMPMHARRFDALFRYRWDRIVEFLKLHYVLSERSEPYWRAHREPAHMPPRLAELLAIWRHQPPSSFDLPQIDEVFPPASYQYVLYGMGWPAPPAPVAGAAGMADALAQVRQRGRTLAAGLPTQRAYFDALRQASRPRRASMDTSDMPHHAILTAAAHAETRVRHERGPEMGDAVMSCLIVPDEFRRVQNEYVILFRRNLEEGTTVALALFGFDNGENLYLADGRWDARYIPLAVDIQPLLIGGAPEAEGAQVHIDMASPRLSQTEGTRLFDADGQPSTFLEDRIEKLGALDTGYRASAGFFAALERHALLEPLSIEVTLDDGSINRLVGFHVIDEDRLQALGAAALDDLHREGHLMPIFMALASHSNLARLIARKNAAAGHG